MKIASIGVLLLVVYLSFGLIGYIAVKQGNQSLWWFIGVGIFSILFGATAATISTSYKIYLREKRHKEIRAMMWHKGEGRD